MRVPFATFLTLRNLDEMLPPVRTVGTPHGTYNGYVCLAFAGISWSYEHAMCALTRAVVGSVHGPSFVDFPVATESYANVPQYAKVPAQQ